MASKYQIFNHKVWEALDASDRTDWLNRTSGMIDKLEAKNVCRYVNIHGEVLFEGKVVPVER